MVERISATDSQAPQEWLLKRNCSLAPRQLAGLFLGLASLALLIGAAWTLHGARFVIWFALIEVLALTAAFIAYSRHATDFERVVIERRRLVIERNNGSAHDRVEIDRPARIELSARRGALLHVISARRDVEFGRFVSDAERRGLATELKVALCN